MAESQSPKAGFMSRVFHSKSQNKLRKQPPAQAPPVPSKSSLLSRASSTSSPTASPLSPPLMMKKPLAHGAIYRPTDDNRDEQTGERRDDTDLLHGLAHHESHDSLDSLAALDNQEEWRPPGEPDIASLTVLIWARIAAFLSPGDKAALAFSTRTLMARVGTECWWELEKEENEREKIRFLMTQDEKLPGHLLCFSCARYHKRVQMGLETLKRKNVLNPVYHCPMVGDPGHVQPRARIAPGWDLPFPFVQLVMRGHKYGVSTHGIPLCDLERRWTDPNSGWTHQSRYYIHKGHLLMRVVSKTFAAPKLPPSGVRHLLYSREDYTPYFSVCAHWQDGELMPVCKCALSHIPENYQTLKQQFKQGPGVHMKYRNPQVIVSLCSRCRPMRRCPECPSEYLVELKLAEDKEDPVIKFKQAIVVTRWCDFGDGTSTSSPEWCAINGLEVEDREAYDSFAVMSKRAISGIFEAQSGVTMLGQRLKSLNPKRVKLGEEGDDWY
ncbi:hypothetical protein QTJ16_002266 [Diplocarpon rosae]|uniref:Uncharacterized protein n=1 Tax=Diplocarpon rosae TaxID=946125 RepID=A0AAD9WGD6_9HELO|nr:hypothetical protein QTJ16_002266 [Diplocarpon rosae]